MPTYKYTLAGGKVRWYCSFCTIDWKGNNKRIVKRGFKTQREAKDYEIKFLSQANDTADIVFSELVNSYMEDIENRLKPTTIETKKHIIENKILPYFKKLKIKDIDSLKIRKWQNELINLQDKNGNYHSDTYLRTIHSQMSAIMNYAVKHYKLVSNPCYAAGSIGSKKADEMNIWTQKEYELFSEQIRKPAVKLAFDILFYTGMRVGEVLALTPADILPSKRISINKTFAQVNGEDLFLTPKTPKSKRDISIPDFIYDEINQYINMIYGIEDNERIFYFGKGLLEIYIKKYADRAGLKRIRVHDLRHSHASMLIEMNFNILEISRRLGHESVKTTLDIYSHLYPDKDIKLANKLNELRK